MTKLEVTLSPDYVPSWTIVDAVRELFQNALDQQAQHSDNVASWSYNADEQILNICNATAVLEPSTLLLGATSKANDNRTIGQFGEGYKIATLVLLRNNKQITFYNYGAREIWKPRFVKSKRFGNTNVLTFFIDTPALWSKVPDNNLTIEIAGITTDEYADIVASNLHLRDDYKVLQSSDLGEVVDIPGQVFVNGLYVRTYKCYKCGYNFKPEHLHLDRDRKMVSDFDLRWTASKLWASSGNNKMILSLLKDNAVDIEYLPDMSYMYDADQLSKLAVEDFLREHGATAIPVTTQVELERVPRGYKGVLVYYVYNKLLRRTMVLPEMVDPEAIDYKFKQWFAGVKNKLTDEEVSAFERMLEEL